MSNSFKIVMPAAPAYGPSFLGQWLAEVLCVGGPLPDIAGMEAQAAFARQFACLARLLLQLSGVPVFDLPESLCTPGSEGKFIIELRLPELGIIPGEVSRHVLKVAADLCQALVRTPVTATATGKLFAEIERLVIAPAQGVLVFGKSTMQILRCAHRLGIPFFHLGAGIYQFGWGSKARRMERSMVDRDSVIAKQFLRSKAVAAGVMRMLGLPAPVHVLVNAEAELPAAAAQIGFPLVVKPADGGRGEAVVVDIMDMQALTQAFEAARKPPFNGQVIVERQVVGVCHRLFIANGKLLYAVKRLPMSVRGDGRRSVAELVKLACEHEARLPPWQRSPAPTLDDAALQAMGKAGWNAESVPGEGVLVPLRRIESTESGGVDEDVSARVHPDNLAAALCAAQAMGLENAGVDLISADIAVPWYDNGAIINEVNIGPLMGGGEISRSRIPAFFHDFLGGDGKIPLERFAGEGASARAHQRQSEHLRSGLRCFVTAADKTFDAQGKPVVMPFTKLEERMQALLCRADVDALMLIES
jgi:cyanophycin synthetase